MIEGVRKKLNHGPIVKRTERRQLGWHRDIVKMRDTRQAEKVCEA